MFEWDEIKNQKNQEKHGVSFQEAKKAFLDPERIIVEDLDHSKDEQRYFCIGKVGEGVLTVRFTYRSETIRIIGTGYWRKGKKRYEEENKIHR
ncbi:BrnT family toxin [bacterium]|nr:BrnT family toxin [bacterium]